MPSSSFQSVTMYDYLRILFQRMHILIVCVLLGGAVAVFFAFFVIPTRYMASMEIMVVQGSRNNPFMRQMLPPDTFRAVITDVQERLQGQPRLKLLVRNLRLSVKNRYVRQHHPNEAFDGHDQAARRMLGAMSESERVEFLSRLELVTLAKLLGVMPLAHPYEMTGGEEGNLCEYLLDGENEIFLQRLAELLFELGEKVTTRGLHARAVVRLDDLLSAPEGLAQFTGPQLWELRKEHLAADRLRETGLYRVCAHSDPEARAQLEARAAKIRGGLDVRMLRKQFIQLKHDTVYASQREAIPDLVVWVAYRMIQAEYYATEVGHREKAKFELQRQIERLEEELLAVNKDLANYNQLKEIMLAYAADTQEGLQRTARLRPEDFQLPRVTVHIQRINRLQDEKREIELDIAEKEERIEALRGDLADPQKTHETRTTVARAPAPRVLQLRQELVKLQERLARLRETLTDKHPFVQEVLGEVARVKRSLEASRVEEEVVVTTESPEVREWERELRRHQEDIQALRAKREGVLDAIAQETQKAVAAPKRLQEYEDLQRERSRLSKELANKRQILAEVQEAEQIGEGVLRTVFEVHAEPRPPASHYQPNRSVIVVIGLVVGVFAAALMIFLVEYADHSIKGIEDVRRHFDVPVLGTIPEFEFQAREAATIWGRLRRRRVMRWLGLGPPEGARRARQQIVARRGGRLRTALLVVLVLLLAGGGAFYLFGRDTEAYKRLRTYIQELRDENRDSDEPETGAPEPEDATSGEPEPDEPEAPEPATEGEPAP